MRKYPCLTLSGAVRDKGARAAAFGGVIQRPFFTVRPLSGFQRCFASPFGRDRSDDRPAGNGLFTDRRKLAIGWRVLQVFNGFIGLAIFSLTPFQSG